MPSPRIYVLCSRYSKACSEFMRTVTAYNIDVIVPVYIDNPTARKIVASSALDIQTVPCVIGSVNGYMATYEGREAFDWLSEIAKQYVREPQPEDPIPPPESEPERHSAHVGHKLADSKTLAEKMRAEREMDDDLMHDRKRRPRHDMSLQSVNPQTFTGMDQFSNSLEERAESTDRFRE